MSRYRKTMLEALQQVEAYDKDHEVSMARTDLQSIADKALVIDKHLKEHHSEETGIEGWIASKITKASDYINAVHDHMVYSPEMNESFSSDLVKKAKEIAKKFADNMTKAVDEIEKIKKGLSKDKEVYATLRQYNEEVDLNEGSMKDIFTANQEGESVETIAKRLKLSVATVKKILGLKEEDLIEFTTSMIKDLQKSYADLKGKTISPEKATALSKHLDRLDVPQLKQLVSADIPFVTTIAKNKLYKKTGKFESVEEAQDLEQRPTPANPNPKEDTDKQQALNAKDKEIESLKGQITVLRAKIENEKNRAVKPIPNPETGEVPLTIGIAHKLLKDKEEKEKETKKESVNYPEGARLTYESIQAVKNKAEKTGMPYSILKQVYDRGMAAWRGGHRPGATQVQWALARVNSFVTKSSGTWGGADSDLAKKVKGEK